MLRRCRRERQESQLPENSASAVYARRSLSRRLLLLSLFLLALAGVSRSVFAQGSQVFGLRGKAAPALAQTFSVFFTDASGRQYGLVGATPAVDEQLSAYAAQQAAIRVWGQVRPPDELSTAPVIVVSEATLDTPPPTPTRAVPGGPTAVVDVYAAYVRSGPGRNHPSIGVVRQGALCAVTGRSTTSGWWRLSCPGVTGWVMEGLYTIRGDTSQVPLLAESPPTPPREIWRGQGFANPDLAGTPTVTFDAPAIAFDWGVASPNPALPPDNFSLRFERTIAFTPGLYRLEATYDDGVRVYVAGQLIIDDWREGATRTSAWQGNLGGELPVRIDYVEYTGLARLFFTYRQLPLSVAPMPPTPPAPNQPPSGAWLASYYGNPTLSEPALLTRVEPRGDVYPLNYEFSLGSAVPGVTPDDNWSARWRGRYFFDAGDYRFLARGNDGVRIYLDGIRIIDAWPNTQDTVSNVFYGLGAGEHEIVVDFFDIGGLAWVRAWWERLQ